MKKILFCAFLILILLPLSTHAAWWKPSTWGNSITNTSSADILLQSRVEELEAKLNAQPLPTSSASAKSTLVMELESKIASITKENTQLKAQIKALTEKINPPEPTITPLVAPSSTPDTDLKVDKALVVTQFIPSKDAKGYGYYQTSIKVTAGNQDLYIPQSTTDSATQDIVGVSYSVIGETSAAFKGVRKSTVSCSTTKPRSGSTDCVVKAGTSLNIDLTISLKPSESGTFAVKLGEIRYYFESSINRYSISPKKIKIEGETESDMLYI